MVSRTALERGFDVLALSRHPPTDAKLAKHWSPFDLTRPSHEWPRVLSDCEAVIHLAAAKRASTESDRELLWRTNVEGTLSLIEAIQAADVRHLVLCGAANLPSLENPSSFNSVSRSLYLASKLAQEWSTSAACAQAGIRCVTMRVSSIVGDGQSVLDQFARSLLAGEDVRIANGDHFGADLVGAMDVVEGLLLAVDHRLEGRYNLSSGTRTSIGEAARLLATIAGLPESRVQIEGIPSSGDAGFLAVDCARLVAHGYQPRELALVLHDIVFREREGGRCP
jgi:UDP-glucose 4-epimerase